MKIVKVGEDWGKVVNEYDEEAQMGKLMAYDKTLLGRLGNISGNRFLDYGSGPGVLASTLQRLGADVKAYDKSQEMRHECGEKIGHENIYPSNYLIPPDEFDVVVCNLVMCIVPDHNVAEIIGDVRYALVQDGHAYLGFCNPRIFDVPESALDFRYPTGEPYEDNHSYRKLKKEGGYEIVELHRPIEWYSRLFEAAEFSKDTFFTPEYEMGGKLISDFVIFDLTMG